MAQRLVAFLALALLSTAFAQAQQLQRLHVRSFTLSSDAAHPRIDVPFNVTLTIRVAENVDLQNVFLPAFAGPEELGDVRQQNRGRSGTLYRETLTLVSHVSGPLTIGSAYLDAIDARDGKPKRFVSNDLHLNVPGPALNRWRPDRAVAWTVLAAIAVLSLLYFRLRNAPAQRAAPLQPPPVNAAPADPHPLEASLSELRVRRDRSAVMRVRSALWHIAGASEGQTLAAVLEQPPAVDENLRRMLIAVERAAFIEERGLDAAIDDVLTQREGSIA